MLCLRAVNDEVLLIVKNALLPYFPDLTQSKLVDALCAYDAEAADCSVKVNFYLLQDAAKMLNVTLPTLYNWEKKGRLTIKKIGKVSYVPKSDIQKIISG